MFSVDEYSKMAAAGILTEDDPVELLEGWIKFKMPRNPPHDTAIKLVCTALDRSLSSGWHSRPQSALVTSDSVPEPDVAVVSGDIRRYSQQHPNASEAALVVEVAESSLARDRDDKLRIYARAGIPTYWIVNLVDKVVEIYTLPSGAGPQPAYGRKELATAADTIALHVGGVVIQVPAKELLP